MIHHIFFVASLAAATLASPQWYGGLSGGFGGHHGGVAPLGHDGTVVDTPEVAQLKASHLAALAEAASRAKTSPGETHDDGSYNSVYDAPASHSYAPASYGPRYHGPPAPLGPDGRVVDTPEVAAAKAHHFSLYNAAAQHAPAYPATSYESGEYNPAWDGQSIEKHY